MPTPGRPGPPPPTTSAVAAAEARTRGRGVRSSDAANVADLLLRAPAGPRRATFKTLGARERTFVLGEVQRETGSLYGLWHDTPSGFTEDVLGESIWSKQREVLDSVTRHTRTMVPAGFGVGKTWLAGRLVAWAGCVNPAGTMVVVTTATRFRQVRYQLWPHIRKVVARAGLPGFCDTTQWKMPDVHGNDVVVAYGFTAPSNDEAAMQGIHGTPRLLLIVDEAGGIDRLIGNGTNNLLTGDAAMLAIGNPPADDPRSWFEVMCEEGHDPEKPGTITIPIRTLDSPLITGERVPYCNDCPPTRERHSLAIHLPSMDWVDRTIREYGPDHPYVIAKVHARFPKGGANKAIPLAFIEAAQAKPDPQGPEYVRLCDLGLPGETAEHTVKRGAWIRLGVDVAADGGDEMTIYRAVGDAVEFRHASSGQVNINQVDVAGRVLEEIKAAQLLARALGTEAPVRVKIDRNGLGHGAHSLLERWGEEGEHEAQIVGVMVSESIDPDREDPGQVMRPWRKRDEMWLAARSLMQPAPTRRVDGREDDGDDAGGHGQLRLRVDHKCAVQLSTPNLGTNSSGASVVESKKAMRARGIDSPDRADGALLSVYEPEDIFDSRRLGLMN
ncbi:hypothetical protein [Actinacidiphila sp. bgisy160]|uniref:hypothetical protein n=1 Tax=Actinacidiphila sp. bgisy160 TaxID=3413796 RepID=UPI003D7142B2